MLNRVQPYRRVQWNLLTRGHLDVREVRRADGKRVVLRVRARYNSVVDSFVLARRWYCGLTVQHVYLFDVARDAALLQLRHNT